MQQRLNIVTILVEDLHQALAFYRDGLGWQPWWPTAETTDEIDHAAFHLGHGLSLVLYPGAKRGQAGSQPLVALAQFVDTKKRLVETTLQQATAAGATVIAQATMQEWGGYTTKFADLDGCHWEITWNPHYATDSKGEGK